MSDYPYLGKSLMRFKSPHATDLSFEADQFVRILGPAPEDADWARGETLDGKQGIFPKDFVEKTDEQPAPESTDKAEEEAEPSPLSSAPPASATQAASTSAAEPSSTAPRAEDEASSSGDKTPVEAAPISIPTREPSTPLPPSNSPPPTDPAPIATSTVPPPIDTHVPETSPAPSVPSSVHSPPTILTDTPTLSARPSYNDAQLGPSADEPKAAPAPAAAAPTSPAAPPAPKPQPQEAPSAVKVGGMSASDAKESITKGGGSLKDRMAMFQQKAAPAPPPPVPRGKPGNWAWKNKAAAGSEGTAAAPASGDAPAAASSSPSAAPVAREAPVASPSPTRPAAGAMSASDAKESITKSGGSLKERMAALQGAGAFGEPAAAKSPPIPSGKPKVWKRPEPVAAPEPEVVEEKKKSKWTVEEHKSDEEGAGGVEKSGKAIVPDDDTAEGGAAEETAEEPAAEENDEEAAERARRAAIAARMAKIGARGPMGMMKPPPPVPVKREPSSERPVTSPEVEKDEPKPTPLPGLAPTTETPSSPDNSSAGLAPLPAMPRRAAPPRRKPAKSTPSGAAGSAPPPAGEAEEEAGHGHPVPPNPAEVPEEKSEAAVEEEKVREEVGKGEQGAQGAAIAGIALAPVGEPKEEPTGTAVPVDEDAQAELTKVDPEVEHKEKTLAVIVDEPEQASLVASPSEEIPAPSVSGATDIPDPAAGHHHRRISIPLPARDASYHESDVEFREFRKGDIGRPIHDPEHLEDKPRSRSSTKETTSKMGEAEEADDDEQDHQQEPTERKRSLPPAPIADEPKDSSPESTPPPPPPRSLPQVPPPAAALGGYDTAGENTADDEPGPLSEEEAEVEEEKEDEVVVEEEAPPPPPRRTSAIPPLPKIVAALAAVDPEQEGPTVSLSDAEAADALGTDEEPEDKEEEAPPPPPPARRPSVKVPALPSLVTTTAASPSPMSPASPTSVSSPSVGGRPAIPMGFNATPVEAAEAPASDSARQPSIKEATVVPAQEKSAPQEESSEPQDEQDEEQARRQTIAARMAKLGGANQMRMFGGPPPPKKPSRDASKDSAAAPTAAEAASISAGETAGLTADERAAPEEEEDEEAADAARRARALAKMGAMGGVRFGMGGFGAPPPAPAREASPEPEEDKQEEEAAPPPPPRASAPVLSAPTTEQDEQEEDEPEQEDEDATPPPPPPARRPSVPVARPLPQPPQDSAPPPVAEHFAEPESFDHGANLQDDNEDAPPPPARPARGLPSLAVNTEQPAPVEHEDNASPISPSAPDRRSSMKRFSGLLRGASRSSMDESPQSRPSMDEPTSRPSMDHSQHSNSRSASQTHSTIPESSERANAPSGQELTELSRTIGAAVARSADSLVGQSKKAVIADGTSFGFVSEALYQAHAAEPTQDGSYGHVVFHQSGSSLVQRRDDIRAGDVVSLSQCAFKGKKNLASYSTDVGQAVGVVLEFEAKKGKMRVAQAAGRANHYPTVEAVSYRLEDLKSGEVKVFRPVAA